MIENMPRKTDKLTTRSPTLRDDGAMRIPVDSLFGQSLLRCLYKLHPSQERMYCKVASKKQMKFWASVGLTGVYYSPNQPLGVNYISKYMKSALTRLGYEGETGHAFRRLFITSLPNDAGVSIEESMRSAGHNSVAAQRPYIVRNGVSESAKFAALGITRGQENPQE